MKVNIARMATAAGAFAGCAVAAVAIGSGPAHAYTYGPFQWCPGAPLPNDPPRPDGQLNWDMSVCHTYYTPPGRSSGVPAPRCPTTRPARTVS
ncbi:hypothetical protein [Mycobacterium sp. M26]|uniref:hypothetical protein n=1 Tax=Mycobacterium sp. M26 TaxID=1762962 RepID=UPI000AB1D68E|nr:hypothetical protein [Mycobacterium sp. M26]